MRGYSVVAEVSKNHPSVQTDNGILLSPELIEEYMDALMEKGCIPETLKAYQMKLGQLYQYLPEDKLIRADTLTRWQTALLEAGYAPSTVNICTAAANGLVVYCGHREFQVEKPLKCDYGVQPELTRNEYLRLLSTARILNKQQTYLLVKLFATTGLSLNDLPRLAVEAVACGTIAFPDSLLHIPECLRLELLDYIQREGISSGSVFVARSGAKLRRTHVTKLIQSLCRDARVSEEKATPRCLKKLYQATQTGIRGNLSLLVEQAHDRLLETEQLVVGWKQEEQK